MQRINRTVWISEQKKLGTEIKWFGKIPLETSASFFIMEDYRSMKTPKMIGAGFLYTIGPHVDCSFFVLPEFRRKGFAREFIIDLISKFEHIQFTVSKFNQPSLNLFKSIIQLENTMINEKNNTFIFKPI